MLGRSNSIAELTHTYLPWHTVNGSDLSSPLGWLIVWEIKMEQEHRTTLGG